MMVFDLQTERLHQQEAHRPYIIAGTVQLGLGFGIAVESARIGGLGELIQVVGKPR